jgi:hypothetical protein
MHRTSEDILPEITDRQRPGADDTIAEYLALLLEQRGLLSADDVCEMLGGTNGPCH